MILSLMPFCIHSCFVYKHCHFSDFSSFLQFFFLLALRNCIIKSLYRKGGYHVTEFGFIFKCCRKRFSGSCFSIQRHRSVCLRKYFRSAHPALLSDPFCFRRFRCSADRRKKISGQARAGISDSRRRKCRLPGRFPPPMEILLDRLSGNSGRLFAEVR